MINQLVSTDLVWRLGWTLLHSVWQILLIGMFVAIGLLVARKSASIRYWMTCSGLALMFVPLVMTFVLVPPPVSQESEVVVTTNQYLTNPREQSIGARSSQSITGHSSLVEFSDETRKLDGSDLENESLIAMQSATVSLFVSWFPWLVGGWCLGVAVLAIWNGGGWLIIRKLRSHGMTPVDEDLSLRMEILTRHLQISRPVKLVQSMLVEVPMVIGWLRPMILMPVSLLSGTPSDQLDAILAHELAHIRRHDYLVNLFQLLAESLLFYHPVVWILSKQIRIEREFCCDDIAISACSEKSTFVQALARVESSRPIPVQAMSLFGRGTSLSLQRARRIMGKSRCVPHTGIAGVCALLLALFVGLGVADSMHEAAATDSSEIAKSINSRQESNPNIQVELGQKRESRNANKRNFDEAAIDTKGLRIDFTYEGPSDKPFYDFTLSTTPFSKERNPMWLTQEIKQTNHAKISRITGWLSNSGFLLHAKKSVLPQAPGSQRYVMRVTIGDEILTENLGWDLGMLLRLDSLRSVLAEGDAQAETPLDPLLGRLSGYRRNWTEGRVVNDIKTQLSASKKVFQAGMPINVKLKVENTGEQTRKVGMIFGDQGEVESAVKQIEFKVFDVYGNRVTFLAGTSQFLEQRKSLEPGQAETFEFDLTKAHYLRRPGQYTAVYESWNQLDSNSFDFEVTPGSSNQEDLTGRLLPLLSGEWYMIANPNFEGKVRPGINFEEVDGFPIRFQNIPRHGNMGDISIVWLWFTKEKASPRVEIPESRYLPSSQYLGKTGRWHFYAFADEKSLKRWPTVLEDVKKKFIEPESRTKSRGNPAKPVVNTVAADAPNKKDAPKDPGLIGHIYAVDRDGTNLELLADETLLDGYTFLGGSAWSHDEKWIACGATPYPGRSYSKSHLVKFCINGPDEGKKVDLGCGLSPSWSPDDKQISFLINGKNPIGAKAGLWVMDADGNNRRRLGYAVHGQWSPDGESILAVSSHKSPRKFLLFDVKTGKKKELLTNYTGVGLPTWAPNKKQFAATILEGDERVLGIFDAEEAPTTYTELWRSPWNGGFDETWPDWSPDGNTIAFTVLGQNGSSIQLIGTTEGSVAKQLDVAPENTEVLFVAWSPDSKRLSFSLMGPGLIEFEQRK